MLLKIIPSALVLCLVYCCTVAIAYAQSAQEFKNSYTLGKKLLGSGNLRGARDAFQQVARESPNNAYYPHGVYLYSLTLLKSGDAIAARQALLAANAQFQSWPNADEAQLLLATTYFELNDGAAAQKTLAGIKNPAFKSPIAQLKQHYFAKFSLEKLKELYSANASDALLTEALYDKLLSQAVSPEDKTLFRSLQVKLGKASASSALPSALKGEYNVAVVLPFMKNELNPAENGRKYQFVLDLYEGMNFAKQDLAKLGIKINLFAYDTERNNGRIRALAEAGKWEGSDLIIGPLYPDNFLPIADFAKRNELTVVNPIGNDRELLAISPMVFLTEATPETQARRSASFALKMLGGYANGAAYIYYSPTPEDSIMAHEYKQVYEQAKGRVAVFSRLSANMLARVNADLRQADSLSHVMICANQKPLATSMLSAVLNAKHKLPVLVPKNWLEMEGMDYAQLEAANVHFIYPGFVPDSPQRDQLDRAFVATNNMIPSRFVYEGYETLYFFGQQLKRHGTGFGKMLTGVGFVRGQVLPGFDFSTGRDNQFVPICRFNNGVLEIVNWAQPSAIDNRKD